MRFRKEVTHGDEYPGQFLQADLIDPSGRPFTGATADVVWVSWPCIAYAQPSAIAYGSSEEALAQNPRITDEFREWLLSIAGHYIIENVPNASYHGDLDANVQLNGLGFGKEFDNTRVFETTFECPDVYEQGEPTVTMNVDGDQSIKDLAKAKGVPSSWGKSAVRSAMPACYVSHLLSYCPSIGFPGVETPQKKLTAMNDGPGRHRMFFGEYCGGHICDGECDGSHGTGLENPNAGFNETVVRSDGEIEIKTSSFRL